MVNDLNNFIGRCFKVVNKKKSLTIEVNTRYHSEEDVSLIALTTDDTIGYDGIANGNYSQKEIYKYIYDNLMQALPKNIEARTGQNNKSFILKKNGKLKFPNFSFFKELF